ncbi:hypothetical protein D9M71_639940 [compost metagenome]
MVALVRHADLLQQRLGFGDALGARALLHMHRAFDDVLQHRHVRPQAEVLKHHAQLRAYAVDLAAVGGHQHLVAPALERHLFTGDMDLAGIGGFQQVDAAQEGALARAAGAEDRHHVTLAGIQRDALEHFQVAERLADVFHLQDRIIACSHATYPLRTLRAYFLVVERAARGARGDRQRSTSASVRTIRKFRTR